MEGPSLAGTYHKYKGRVSFVSITGDSKETAEEFIKRFAMPWPCLFGAPEEMLRALGAYCREGEGWRGSPVLYLIGPDGTIIWNDRFARYCHQDSIRELEQALDEALEKDKETRRQGDRETGR
jgi:hypothetical protein